MRNYTETEWLVHNFGDQISNYTDFFIVSSCLFLYLPFQTLRQLLQQVERKFLSFHGILARFLSYLLPTLGILRNAEGKK
ncbi:hypothetical protein [Fischerella thermalis]|jgi:hypothetical protein|uniref:Uncharacterized protein n=1 Tax=Fischerella thermalis JSC-11 TaxID=741277 RepID=G6FVE5_9CYAN|nr:hypothetical protein [Fischerella thermalis]PLZ76611.1 hypothetical protein CBP16_21885 [Fischerella thermalis WC217]RDH51792.1 hypothetical protein CBF18_07340 [Mastigocladus laminosus WC112]EHC12200.1 hypothetical protein FJSC11DRAFT_2842 [Fischerella thermalis JSC-11]PLZ10429.1 hypothetical protein CBP17_11085 [Fischerella thermalis WC114]PLZ19975.1 hypothetical protein CBP19_00850 [Fischerella thermalis WC1110]